MYWKRYIQGVTCEWCRWGYETQISSTYTLNQLWIMGSNHVGQTTWQTSKPDISSFNTYWFDGSYCSNVECQVPFIMLMFVCSVVHVHPTSYVLIHMWGSLLCFRPIKTTHKFSQNMATSGVASCVSQRTGGEEPGNSPRHVSPLLFRVFQGQGQGGIPPCVRVRARKCALRMRRYRHVCGWRPGTQIRHLAGSLNSLPKPHW